GRRHLDQPSLLGASAASGARSIGEAAADLIAAERDRLALWLPVFFGAGIGLYFGLPYEPSLWAGLCVVLTGALAMIVGRRTLFVLIPEIGRASCRESV